MMRARIDKALLLARTVGNLRGRQVLHRVRLRAQRFPPSHPVASEVIARLPVAARRPARWPTPFTPLDLQPAEGVPSPEDNAAGRFTFLNDARDLGQPLRWDAPGASRLWRYHLHYMDFLWSLAAHSDRDWARSAFAGLWRSWEAGVPFGVGDPWHPYVASLRAWALCATHAALAAGTPVQQSLEASLQRHARFLRWHVEHDVGGNHLVKNLKALAGLGIFFGDHRLCDAAVAQLRRQAHAQVLADGGHYERSPSYHCQVLGDLIDVAGLLDAAGRPPVAELDRAIGAMRRWLGNMLMPDGDVPLFNDCTLVGRARIAALRPGPPPAGRLTVLVASGYVVMQPDPGLHLVADVGDPCPPELPAHAQADCLSFELAVDGRRVVVDPGTSTYQPGRQRAWERSTAAHNTVTVDGADQTEVWGTFRAARLARATLERADDDLDTITVAATHDGYRRLPGRPVHRRTWRASAGLVTVTDEVRGAGTHEVVCRLRCADPDAMKLTWSGPPGLEVREDLGEYATRFGQVHEATVVSGSWRGALPATIQVELYAGRSGLQGS